MYQVGQHIHGFVVETIENLAEIDGQAVVMRHENSGARLLHLANQDVDKAFCIGFKTPPVDDTGVFHILEHSVLCGSDKFPVKEPFVNLLKNSAQTFLNAMTFPDKTIYPVASTNEQDLLNLMDVYLDAVLHPAIYEKEAVFKQEGWHLEVERDEDGVAHLAYNGVVFNEMKGALSSPDAVAYNELQALLFPGTAYAFESGGKPEAIPGLTYEAYLDQHARHYRLDNSYVILYGDLDPERFLGFLDEAYFAPCATLRHDAGAPNEIGTCEPVVSVGNKVTMETAASNSYVLQGYVTGDVRDHVRQMAVDVLLDVLAGSNEAPLKKALLSSGIAVDVDAYLADSVRQPFVVLQLKGLSDDATERFRGIVTDVIGQACEQGLERDRVEACLSHAEFVMREANYGMSDGVALAMASLCGWLYDDSLATAYLKYEEEFSFLREHLDEGYFEQVLREVFLENDHWAEVELVPLEEQESDELAEGLLALEAGLDEAGIAAIEADVAALREHQEAPDDPAALAALPHLGIGDLDEAPVEPAYALMEGTPLRCLRHEVSTRGIAYAFRYYEMDQVAFEDLPYVPILAMMMGKLDTATHRAAELDVLLRANLGELGFVCEVHENLDDAEACTPKLCVGSSALAHNAAALAQVPDEIMLTTRFEDVSKIREVLQQKRVRMELAFADSGHSAAMSRVTSYYLPAGVVREQMGGVGFYRFLCELLDDFDARAEALCAKLSELAQVIFRDASCLLSFAGPDEALASFFEAHAGCGGGERLPRALSIPAPVAKNEAFLVPANVTFSAMGFDSRELGVAYDGSWLLASRALSYDYLWNEVRVKGGAYGCGFQAMRSGNVRFYSFRDPRIDETLGRFGAAGEWLAAFDPDEAEFEGYVVSTVAGLDRPVKPRNLVRRQGGWFFAGLGPEERIASREQVIRATVSDVNAFGALVTKAAAAGHVCVFGGKEIIEAAETPFEVIPLIV